MLDAFSGSTDGLRHVVAGRVCQRRRDRGPSAAKLPLYVAPGTRVVGGSQFCSTIRIDHSENESASIPERDEEGAEEEREG